ncbi:MAG: T9SS type A sorting domain-containing protein, partial ['Candidatus Kapabacteria' thiocyanatum]|nr:T9SS type A sorting domain-containing protein ['Candidatus Kapabacteria' thiocyanatum]
YAQDDDVVRRTAVLGSEDFDADGFLDTVTVTVRYDAEHGKRYRGVNLAAILWGYDAENKDAVADTTVLDVTLDGGESMDAYFYDTDKDGIHDIVVYASKKQDGETVRRRWVIRPDADMKTQNALAFRGASMRTQAAAWMEDMDAADTTQSRKIRGTGYTVTPLNHRSRSEKRIPRAADTILMKTPETTLTLAPNPATNEVRMHLKAENLSSPMLRIMDNTGRLVMHRRLSDEALSSGSYVVKIVDGGRTIVESILVVQR